MPPLRELASGPGLGELFPGKDEHDVLAFVPERHAVGKGIPPHGPPQIEPEGLIDPRSRHVERLVAKSLDHPEQLWLGSFAWHLGNETDNPWHISAPSGRTAYEYGN